MSTTLSISPDGLLSFIWDDSLAGMKTLGPTEIRRASHVEPDENGQWWANLAPSGGPKLGPFELRQQAIDAEIQWLEER